MAGPGEPCGTSAFHRRTPPGWSARPSLRRCCGAAGFGLPARPGRGCSAPLLWLHDATVPDWRAEARVTLAPDLATDKGQRGHRPRSGLCRRGQAAADRGAGPLDRAPAHRPSGRSRGRTVAVPDLGSAGPGQRRGANLGQRRRSCAGGSDRPGFRRTVRRPADRSAGPGRTAGQRGTRRPRRRGGPGPAGAGRAARLRRARGRAGHDRPRIARQPHPAAQRARGRAPHGRRHRGNRPAAAGPGADGPPAGGARRHGRRARG